MSARNWNRHAQSERVRRQGAEERDVGRKLPPVHRPQSAPAMSKEDLRREADRLLAGYSGPATRIPAAAARTTPEAIPDQQRGRVSREIKDIKRGRTVRQDRDFATAVPAGLIVYCDGACEPNPGVGGWGFAVYLDGVEIHSECGGSVPTTNNIMEMTGALMALRWIASCDQSQDRPRLLCDSQYTVRGCNEWRHSWKARGWRRKGKNPDIANLALWQELDAALTAAPITLEWCKGHAGIIGNERADELSLIGREAALSAEAHDCGDLIADQLRYEVI